MRTTLYPNIQLLAAGRTSAQRWPKITGRSHAFIIPTATMLRVGGGIVVVLLIAVELLLFAIQQVVLLVGSPGL